jgi:hypothetical protein
MKSDVDIAVLKETATSIFKTELKMVRAGSSETLVTI